MKHTRTSMEKTELVVKIRLSDLQDQIRLLDRMIKTATEPDLEIWQNLAQMQSDVYSKLHHNKEISILRVKNTSGRKG